jgi:hypothetical protein
LQWGIVKFGDRKLPAHDYVARKEGIEFISANVCEVTPPCQVQKKLQIQTV